jgi:hypothetical protein
MLGIAQRDGNGLPLGGGEVGLGFDIDHQHGMAPFR